MSLPLLRSYTPGLFNLIKPIASTIFPKNGCVKYSVTKKDSVEEMLGHPPKPKRPLMPFFLYMKDIRQSTKISKETLTTHEILRIIGEKWRSLDASTKEKYSEEFCREIAAYSEQLSEYKKQLAKEDLLKIQEARKNIAKEKEKRKTIRILRREAIALDKPKLPDAQFLRFLEAVPDRQPDEAYIKYLRRKAAEWKCLSESEKQVYKEQQANALKDYRMKMLEWKGKMIRLGKYEVIDSEIPRYLKYERILNNSRKKKFKK
ncbi:Transcription factor A, mitochondrial [Pseudolycoriella hygida]|uniref:Transcription factor A, mitochondrial n=1 Tax=Pseudolycoriella hygida TaxID=35572 RepID=A0A9Q0S866_9DIPT|nr:Transcription factor A, mitochondrial [Pseudolycoriella hygida]